MTENKGIEQPAPEAEDEDDQDVEGHNMMLGPDVTRDLARARTREYEREARENQRAKEAKGR